MMFEHNFLSLHKLPLTLKVLMHIAINFVCIQYILFLCCYVGTFCFEARFVRSDLGPCTCVYIYHFLSCSLCCICCDLMMVLMMFLLIVQGSVDLGGNREIAPVISFRQYQSEYCTAVFCTIYTAIGQLPKIPSCN